MQFKIIVKFQFWGLFSANLRPFSHKETELSQWFISHRLLPHPWLSVVKQLPLGELAAFPQCLSNKSSHFNLNPLPPMKKFCSTGPIKINSILLLWGSRISTWSVKWSSENKIVFPLPWKLSLYIRLPISPLYHQIDWLYVRLRPVQGMVKLSFLWSIKQSSNFLWKKLSYSF